MSDSIVKFVFLDSITYRAKFILRFFAHDSNTDSEIADLTIYTADAV